MHRPDVIHFSDLAALPRAVFGTWTQIAAPELLDMLGAAQFDFTIIDAEHGSFGFETVENLVRVCRANGLSPWVRVPTNDPTWIGKVRDVGVAAVVVPGIESPEDVVRAVAATRFSPEGSRGACPCVGAGDHYVRDWRRYRVEQDANAGIVAVVETRAGLDAIDAICASDGVRALLIGPFDLSVSLGFGGDYRSPVVVEAVERMIAAARRHNTPVMMPVFSPEIEAARAQVRYWTDLGVRLFVLGTDKILVATCFAEFRQGVSVRC